MSFIGSGLHNFTFITILHAFLTSTGCHATLGKSCQLHAQYSMCSICHLNLHCMIRACSKTNKLESNMNISTMGCRPDSKVDQRNIVLWMLTSAMMNKQVALHLKACECMIYSLRTKFLQKGSIENRHHNDRPRIPTRKEDICNVTSSRRILILSSTRIPDLVRNSRDKTVQRWLKWCATKLTSPIRCRPFNCFA